MERGQAPRAVALGLCDLILDHQRREDLVLFPSTREAVPAEQFDRPYA
ncbi:MAG TPA: hypothetical protein VF116_05675 [Ktedonobacterales bacterium]